MKLDAGSYTFIGFIIGVVLSFFICTIMYDERLDDIVANKRVIHNKIIYEVTPLGESEI